MRNKFATGAIVLELVGCGGGGGEVAGPPEELESGGRRMCEKAEMLIADCHESASLSGRSAMPN